MSHQQSISYVGTGLPGLNQYYARINVSCSRTQRSDPGEARTWGPLVSSQALFHSSSPLIHWYSFIMNKTSTMSMNNSVDPDQLAESTLFFKRVYRISGCSQLVVL